jgi:hypothetical protein
VKKILSLLLVFGLAAFLSVGVVGCGGGASDTPTGVDMPEDDGELSEEEAAGEAAADAAANAE